jgi:MFS family permease
MSEESSAAHAIEARSPWKRRIIFGLIGIVLLVLGYFFAAAFLPRWWAHRVGSQVGGSFASGVIWGLFYGVIFTAIPLLVARQAIRKRWRWQTRVGIVVAALVLATPNLMTLGIVFGGGSAAHAGERILDVEGPAFRWATFFGALGGVVVAGVVQYLVSSRRRRGREVKKLRNEVRRRDDETRAANPEADH